MKTEDAIDAYTKAFVNLHLAEKRMIQLHLRPSERAERRNQLDAALTEFAKLDDLLFS
ncbi:hypothetical protein M0654_03625 [Rhizobium sp. NTR19]|uniref:Uncharacterized protein n=1 Tax=Neorhizobium turbinariae TaxID=2937795 RepID=A0ABT0IMG4_9HYPH|nr:hypothetical protein [Neorhizobium turbinariae]MCK8779069.1 hypothetical protein [Neorhizobium turbinariae]